MASHKASAEHLELVKVVRSLHRDLRKLYKCNTADKTDCSDDSENIKSEEDLWSEHCQKQDDLRRYAESMHRLASVHWTENNSCTRIEWCYYIIKDYFHGGGLHRELIRYNKRLLLLRRHNKCSEPEVKLETAFICPTKIRLLDVGSCYNPFGVYDDLDVLGIDLCPATKDVGLYRCDFMKLDITDTKEEKDTKEWMPGTELIESLPANHFHVIVFSLLLEYLPLAKQRLRCFLNASALLSERGLLLVVTPDSKHQSRNAPMMKSWRLGLEKLGFHRMRYEKQTHLHCMAFVKVVVKLDEFDVMLNTQLADMFYIPQDLQEFGEDSDVESTEPIVAISRTADQDDVLLEAFSELPEAI